MMLKFPTSNDAVMDERLVYAMMKFNSQGLDGETPFVVRFKVERFTPRNDAHWMSAEILAAPYPAWICGVDDGTEGDGRGSRVHYIVRAVANSWEYVVKYFPRARSIINVEEIKNLDDIFTKEFPKPDRRPEEIHREKMYR